MKLDRIDITFATHFTLDRYSGIYEQTAFKLKAS